MQNILSKKYMCLDFSLLKISCSSTLVNEHFRKQPLTLYILGDRLKEVWLYYWCQFVTNAQLNL